MTDEAPTDAFVLTGVLSLDRASAIEEKLFGDKMGLRSASPSRASSRPRQVSTHLCNDCFQHMSGSECFAAIDGAVR